MKCARRWGIAVALAAVCAGVPAMGQDEAFLHLPAQDRILETLRPGHPRLLATDADWDRAAEMVENEPAATRAHVKLIEQADAMLGQPPSEYVIPDGKRLLATSRRVLTRVQTLAYAYRMTGEPRYAERAWAELDAAAGFKDWNPSHFLDAGEMTAAFGLAYDWLYTYWDDARRDRIRTAIVGLGLSPGLASYRGEQSYGWWVRAHHNWNQVCNGGLALGALAIADEEPEIAAEILHSGLESLRLAMREFAPDGGWAEGPGYWGYATTYNVAHLAALETALGDSFGFTGYPGFDRTGEYPVFISAPSGRTFNYADGHDSPIRAPQLFWLAARFDQPDFAAFEERAAAPSVMDVLWGARSGLPGAMRELPLDRQFEGIGVVTMRSEWDDPNALFVGLKGGSNAVNHSHLELGDFVFDALGVRWALDLGSDNYNMPGYFGGQRWTYYRLRAEGQNTIVLAPGEGPDQDPRASAAVIETGFGADEAWAGVDLSAAYAGALGGGSAVRRVGLVDGRSRLAVEDRIEAGAGAGTIPAWWFMHTRAAVKIGPDSGRAVLTQDGAKLEVRVIEPAGAEIVVMDAAPLRGSPAPSMQNKNEGVRKLAIRLEISGPTTVRVELTPLREEDGAG